MTEQPEGELVSVDAMRDECKTKIREMILLGFSVREINNRIHALVPHAARKTVRKWQQEVRNTLSLSEGMCRQSANVNRGVMRQRLEYLFHVCMVPAGNSKQDPKTALECLKQLMVIDGLTKPTQITKKQNNHINIYGDTKMESLPTAEIKRIADGEHDRLTPAEAEEIIDADVEYQ